MIFIVGFASLHSEGKKLDEVDPSGLGKPILGEITKIAIHIRESTEFKVSSSKANEDIICCWLEISSTYVFQISS